MDDKELDIRKNDDLINALNLADSIVYKTYHSYFNQMEIVECPPELKESDLNDFARFFKVDRFVYEKNENSRDKLVSVFHSVASCGGSIIVLIDSDGEKINYYFGTKVTLDAHIDHSAEVLNKSLSGNFPGTKTVNVPSGTAMNRLLSSVFKNHRHSDQLKQICTIAGVAGLRSKEESHEKLFIQGMEKLVDSMRGETYSLLLIADPVSGEELQIIKRGYENLYSQLAPFAGSELSYGQNESASVSNSITEGLSKSINKSVTDTLTHTKGTSESHTEGTTKTRGMNVNPGGIAGLVGGAIGLAVGGPLGAMVGGAIGGAIGGSVGFNSSTSKNESHTSSTNKSVSKSRALTDGTTETTTEQETETTNKTEGTSRNIQLKFENKAVKNLLEKIDSQLKRLNISADTGMWNCSAYCLADNISTCKIVASSYQSLLRGENSSLETGTITEWMGKNVELLLPWLEKMHHPKLRLVENEITPASFISSAELAIHAGIPQSSVGGLPVLEMAPFGREVSSHWQSANNEHYGNKISLGKIYHMGNEEELPVMLDKKSLASHTFITGSTGSGKSNTVYKLLDELRQRDVTFLVIEPAKGEYKNVFGNNDISIFGTNPALTPLLRINPFVFPNSNAESSKNIHILEHLDRLVEIFNVCWPMYAAMPAVLKDAIEVSYEEAGWDLALSTNYHSPVKYPSFADVTRNIRKIIDLSEYSDENKGNYKGSLITRLKSLSNGIYGLIFTTDELTNQELFDKNVIVDISRIGSIETKALIMGLLIMKLQEYRMTSGKMNFDLKHVTVLEEAHNLLKCTSTEQSSETANLLGKSVEMLTNAIAEMRTYGEGFIIADQSPGLLDLSVIRNTNTKIIMHLPEKEDRELVGKAASLNDDQIEELAKLQCGVAAIYQNNWLQGVLCKVDEFTNYDKNYRYEKPDLIALDKARAISNLKRLVRTDMKNISLKEVVEKIEFTDFKAVSTEVIFGVFSNNVEVVNTAYRNAVEQKTGLRGLYDYLVKRLEPSIENLPDEYRNFILCCVIDESCKNDVSMREIPSQWHRFLEREVR
jgi:hypothetical protein